MGQQKIRNLLGMQNIRNQETFVTLMNIATNVKHLKKCTFGSTFSFCIAWLSWSRAHLIKQKALILIYLFIKKCVKYEKKYTH